MLTATKTLADCLNSRYAARQVRDLSNADPLRAELRGQSQDAPQSAGRVYNYPRERPGVVAPHQKANLDESSRLRTNSRTMGVYEDALKEILLELGIRSYYEPLQFAIGHPRNKDDVWPPDFVTDLRVGGKRVIIETHNSVDGTYKARLQAFLEGHGESYYLIVLQSRKNFELPMEISRDPVDGINGNKYADEIWRLPGIRQQAANLVKGRSTYTLDGVGERDKWEWKERVGEALHSFIEDRADRVNVADLRKAVLQMQCWRCRARFLTGYRCHRKA